MAPEFYFSVHNALSLVTALDQTFPRHAITMYCISNHLNTESYNPNNYTFFSSYFIISSAQTVQFKTTKKEEEN